MKSIVLCFSVVIGAVLTGCPDSHEHPANCGDSHIDSDETCDDGNLTDGDGCDSNCTLTGCGNGILTTDEGCDDGNRIDGDNCESTCVATGCGDGILEPDEVCDDHNTTSGDGCDNNCTITECGNGVITAGESCDDGNKNDGDGCSRSCHDEAAELEPNDDGATSTGGTGIRGNDFARAAADSNGPFTGSVTISAGMSPAGDEDVFKFTNPGNTGVVVKFDVWSGAAGFGIGVPCGMTIDTGINLWAPTGANPVKTNDDRAGVSDQCSAVDIGLLPGENIYAHVTDRLDDAAISAYLLDVTYRPVVCGDGVIEVGEECDDGNTNNIDGCSATCQIGTVCGDGALGPAEQCDDHNTTNNDGCSSTCMLEGATTEVEPNDDGSPSTGGAAFDGNDFGTTGANANGAFTANVTIAAKLNPAGDEDVFKFTNPGSGSVTLNLNIWNLAPGYGIGTSCGISFDSGLHLRNAAGTSLAFNDDRVNASDTCSALSFSLAGGQTVYAHVVEYNDDDKAGSYALTATFQ